MATADTARLVAELTLRDKFTKGVDGAIRKTDELESSISRIGGKAQAGVKSATRNIGILGAVAAGAITTQVIAGIRSLEDLERVTNQTNAVIESTGGAAGVTAKEVRELAEALEEVTTADDKLIQEGENVLLTFTNIGEKTFPRATEALVDMSIALADGDAEAADFGATAKILGKALNDPVKGLAALTRVGVTFTKEQKEQIKAMTEAGDVAGAQALILTELEKRYGEAGKAAGTGFGADMRRFNDALEGAQQALATGFLPLISRVAAVLNERLARPETIAAIKSFGEGLAGGLDDLIGIAEKLPWEAIGTSLQVAGTGARAVLDAFTSLPPWVQTAVITGWGLNKLTGGALTGIVGELAKGLVKGVLGINAGLVTINAKSVVGGGGIPTPGGGPGGGGIRGLLGNVAKAAVPVTIVALSETAKKSLVPENPLVTGFGEKPAFLPPEQAGGAKPFWELIFRNGNAPVVQEQKKTAQSVSALLASQERQESNDAIARANSDTNAARIYAALQESKVATTTAGQSIKAATDAAAAASARAGQQAAAAIKEKDLSVAVSVPVNISNRVSIQNFNKSFNSYKNLYKVAT